MEESGIYIHALEVSKTILAEHEGTLHWKYTLVYMLYEYTHIYTYTHT